MSAASLLAKIEATIEGLLTAMADDLVQEYQIGSRRYRRAEFGTALDALRRSRAELQKEVNVQALGSRVSVGRITGGRA